MTSEYSAGRDFISGAKYIISTTSLQFLLTPFRLNYFHYALKHLTAYTIHPKIDVPEGVCRIADLGTQTA